jgi:excisionase family DNA binding protein
MTKVVVIDSDELRAIVRDELGRFGKQLGGTGRRLRPIGDLLSTTEAALLAGLQPATIRSWVAAGRLRRHRAGRVLRVSRVELEELLTREPGEADSVRTPEQEADRAFGRRRRKAPLAEGSEGDDEGGK